MGTKALLVYPKMPATYWGMHHALPFLGRRATLPPLGLLTVAAMLPDAWELRLLDMNVESLSARDLEGMDLVLVSAMQVQRPSFEHVVKLCGEAGVPVVAGGPYPTTSFESIEGVDFFVLGEAESNLPPFLKDYQEGSPRHLYDDPSHPPLNLTPPPRFDLLDQRLYAGMALQFSRGCPHHCEFCDIVEWNGHVPRTKTPTQFMQEVDLLYKSGWRGALFIVDDNFIGNRSEVRKLLPYLARWQAMRKQPFSLFTEASVDLASDGALMEGMVEAGFNMVFIGIETPDKATLAATHKPQNIQLDLLALEAYRKHLGTLLQTLEQRVKPPGQSEPVRNRDLESHGFHLQRMAARRGRELPPDLQGPATLAQEEFCSAIRALTAWKPFEEGPANGPARVPAKELPTPTFGARA